MSIHIDLKRLEAAAKAVCRGRADLLDPDDVAQGGAVVLLEGRQEGNYYGACRTAAQKLQKLRGFVHRKSAHRLQRVEHPVADVEALEERLVGRSDAQEDAVIALLDIARQSDRNEGVVG